MWERRFWERDGHTWFTGVFGGPWTILSGCLGHFWRFSFDDAFGLWVLTVSRGEASVRTIIMVGDIGLSGFSSIYPCTRPHIQAIIKIGLSIDITEI